MRIEELQRKAKAGSCVAQTVLGISYLYGNNVEVNYKKAFKLLSAATKQRSSRATLHLGYMYVKGLGGRKDLRKATRLFEAVATPNDSSDAFAARIELGRMYALRQPVKALDWYKAAIAVASDDEDSDDLREARIYVTSSAGSSTPATSFRKNPASLQEYPTCDFDDLTVWRTSLPEVKHAVLPPSNNRPNPLVTESTVYVSIFSSGAVCALNRASGKLIWRVELPYLASASVYRADGKLFAKTSHTLYAMETESGKFLWSFCPYGTANEMIYSSPTVCRKRIYIGDRCGFLHCLDADSGKTLWRQQTNKAKNSDVNSTPLVYHGLVVVGTNANRAVAYNAATGKLAWVRKLNSPSVFGPLLYRKFLVFLTDSVYLLQPRTGRVVRRLSWRRKSVSAAETTPRNIVALLRDRRHPSQRMSVVGFDQNRILYSASCTGFCQHIRYSPDNKLMYVAHLQGLDLYRAATGKLTYRVKLSDTAEGVGPVEVQGNTIYAVTGKGHVYALRHPRIKGK